MATEYNLSIQAGESRVMSVTLTNASGAAVDVTGSRIEYLAELDTPIAKDNGSGEDDLGGIEITDGTAGKFEITLEGSDTEDIEQDTNEKHECKVALLTGEKATAFVGHLIIYRSLIPQIETPT